MLVLLTLLMSWPARAVVNLEGCHQLLAVARDVDVPVGPDQIVVRGRLGLNPAAGNEFAEYVVRDDQLEDEITGESPVARFTLTPGDQIFLLDSRGGIEASGAYAEKTVPSKYQRGPGEMRLYPNQPRMLRPPGDRSSLRSGFFARAFDPAFDRRAVVVQTITPSARARVRAELQPWFDLHARRPHQHVVAHGRRFRLRSFEEAEFGIPILTRPEHPSRISGGLGYYFSVKRKDGSLVFAHAGATLALFDDARDFIGFVRVDERLPHFEKTLRRASVALLIQRMTEISPAHLW